MQLKTLAKAGLIILAISSAGAAYSHSGASGVVKERMDAMSAIAKSMKAVGAVMKGEAAFDAGSVESAAREIAKHAKKVPHLFPEGTNKKPSEALPAIWTDWEKFTKIAASMETSAQDLAQAAGEASDIGGIRTQFGALAKTCKACHSDFRLAK